MEYDIFFCNPVAIHDRQHAMGGVPKLLSPSVAPSNLQDSASGDMASCAVHCEWQQVVGDMTCSTCHRWHMMRATHSLEMYPRAPNPTQVVAS